MTQTTRNAIGSLFRASYDRWVADYRRFARMRGFETFNDWPYHRRGFIECWWAPGFHRFWQLWNPGIAYFVYRLFIRLGGRRRWVVPTLLSFVLNGLIHTVVFWPFAGRWSYTLVVAFTGFGVLTVASRLLEPVLRQERWARIVNLLINVFFVAGCFDLGFRVDAVL